MPRKKSVPSNPSPEYLASSIVFEYYKKHYNIIIKDSQYAVLMKRIKDLLGTEKNWAKVALVLITAIDDLYKGNFNPLKVTWPVFYYIEMSLNIPDDAWRYALAAEISDNPSEIWYIDYWLGIWKDNLDIDQNKVKKAKKALSIITKDSFNEYNA